MTTVQDTAAPLAAAIEQLRIVTIAIERGRARIARSRQLGASDFVALLCLHLHGPMSQTELVRRAGLRPSTSTALTDRLESAGVAERRTDPGDRRQFVVATTGLGRQMLDESEALLRAAFPPLSHAELASFTRVLSHIATQVDATIE